MESSLPTPHLIQKSAGILKSGGLVAFPTETVYGLGSDALNELAVSRIYTAKRRPNNHPLIVHISSAEKMFIWSNRIPSYAKDLANIFWPGPMTLILPRSDIAKNFITGGQDSVGLRVPNHKVALELLSCFESEGGLGVAAPSANKFGAVSPTTADSVLQEIGECLSESDIILDGGQCEIGLESTIIDCTAQIPTILRPGAITYEKLSKVVKFEFEPLPGSNRIKTSGTLKSHYSPKVKVALNCMPKPGDGLVALNNIATPAGVIRLIAPRTTQEFARNLYLAFRSGDQQCVRRIVVILPNSGTFHEAIKDRVIKAAGLGAE